MLFCGGVCAVYNLSVHRGGCTKKKGERGRNYDGTEVSVNTARGGDRQKKKMRRGSRRSALLDSIPHNFFFFGLRARMRGRSRRTRKRFGNRCCPFSRAPGAVVVIRPRVRTAVVLRVARAA
jgi:hypothetical protein